MPCRLTADPAAAAAALRAGRPVAFPTETVYGLGAAAADDAAVARLYALKGRPAGHPLIVHLGAVAELEAWTSALPPAARVLAERFMPGPLTLLLPRRPGAGERAAAGLPTIALRVPAHPAAQALLAAAGAGLAAPSANRYGRPSPTTAAHVAAEFPDADFTILDGGPADHGIESTIVSVMPGEEPQLARAGAIPASAIAETIGRPLAPASRHPSPGARRRHYRPRQEVRILAAAEYRSCGEGLDAEAVAAYGFGRPPAVDEGRWLPMPADPVAAARCFYRDVRELEALPVAIIAVNELPAASAWDALRDRLRRMAGPA